MISIILFIVFAILIIAGIVFSIYFGCRNYDDPTIVRKSVFLVTLLSTISMIALIITIPGSFHQVNTGEVAVVRNLGKIVDIRQPGTYFDFYMVNSYDIFDTKVQQDEISTFAYSKDGQTMELEVFLQYQVQSENIMKIATEYGSLDALQARIETQKKQLCLVQTR